MERAKLRLGALLLPTLLGLGCSDAPPPLRVVLITLDTTRLDRLGCYGYPEGTSPRIDELAADSVLFERHYAQAPLTLPSHASILTGLDPVHHGIHENGPTRLDGRAHTLPEILGQHGYRTSAIISAGVLHPLFGLDQGFELYSWESGASNVNVRSDAADATRRAIDWLRAHRDEPRVFQWVHYFDPHGPYEDEQPEGFGSVYDARVAFADEHVGALLDHLKEEGLYDDALIVLTADHGQSLGEHGYDGHIISLYQQTLHAPLLIKLPRNELAGARVESVTRSVDLLPTILAFAGIDAPPTDGLDLRGRMEGGDPGDPLEAYGETVLGVGEHRFVKRSLVYDGWKLISKPALDPSVDMTALLEERRAELKATMPPAHWEPVEPVVAYTIAFERHARELYDLTADPQETTNLYFERPDVAREMEARLATFELWPEGRSLGVPVDSEELDPVLKALGY